MRLDALTNCDVQLSSLSGETDVKGITCDSRTVEPGYLFAALPGLQVDGAKFIEQAFERGAVAALSETESADPRILSVDNPRLVFSRIAARFFQAQPDIAVAVTGTNGKTSVVAFVRQIWASLGLRSASMGTVGVVGPDGPEPLLHTTPDPVTLHKVLASLAERKVSHVALEASSHGLVQHRLDGVRFTAGAFTNLSRDHLDYHKDFEEYFAAKLRLFTELLTPGSAAVVNADFEDAVRVIQASKKRGLNILTVGERGADLKLISCEPHGQGQSLVIEAGEARHDVYLPLIGAFQVSNALVVAGLVIGAGHSDVRAVLLALENLKGAKGRLDLVGTTHKGALVLVDYAHTPDALATALQTLRPYVNGKLHVVIGAGGDRDPGKRPQMGAAAAKYADLAYITDDNPRTEEPALIRKAVLEGCPDAVEIGDRREAIFHVVAQGNEGDIILIAGKGHEPGQTIGTKTIPFSDHDEVLAAIAARGSK
ncbi:MAG: UDP-N-acetylmuramoyl-L-alanyl-D-glutamate--2,6-diaminopimelate ligase [Hyphomicrobiales bacterium]